MCDVKKGRDEMERAREEIGQGITVEHVWDWEVTEGEGGGEQNDLKS